MIVTVTDLYDGVTPETSPVTITVIEGSATSGGGGGAVDSVNGHVGVVVLDADDLADGTTNHVFTAADDTKLAGIATGATANDTDANLKARANHTGSQAIATVTGLQSALDGKDTALAAHEADTTNVHGIADTSALVLTGDSRLTNSRTPTAHATSHQDGGTDEVALDGSQITSGTVADARIASTIARDAEVTAAVSTHEGLSDPHPGYLTTAEGNAAYEAAGAVSTHAAAADPHTGYLKESDYDANTILAATSDNTPAALTVAASRIVGRKASGDISALTAAEVLTILGVTGSTYIRNRVINGNFRTNQRAYVSAASLASGAYGFDRWKATTASTTLTYTSAPQGQSVTINSGGSVAQVIERANVEAGDYVLSWSGTATGRVYNSGGSVPSYAASPVTVTLDGTADVVVEFQASGATKTLSLVQLETGSTATAYERIPVGEELARCQRYYWRQASNATNTNVIIGYGFCDTSAGTSRVQIPVRMPVTMRAIPTVAQSSLNLSNLVNNDFTVSAVTVQAVYSTPDMVSIAVSTANSLTLLATFWLYGHATTAYIEFVAEL